MLDDAPVLKCKGSSEAFIVGFRFASCRSMRKRETRMAVMLCKEAAVESQVNDSGCERKGGWMETRIVRRDRRTAL